MNQISEQDSADREILRKSLDDDNVYVRLIAACGLLRMQQERESALSAFEESLEVFLEEILPLTTLKRETWSEVLRTILEVPSAAKIAVPIVMQALNENDNLIHELDGLSVLAPQAAFVLHEFEEQLLSDPSVRRRRLAAIVLGRLGQQDPSAAKSLIAASKDSHVVVRAAAIEALGRIEPNEHDALDKMVRALHDDYAIVRLRAAEALGRMGSKALAAVPELELARKDRCLAVQSACEKAVAKITRGE